MSWKICKRTLWAVLSFSSGIPASSDCFLTFHPEYQNVAYSEPAPLGQRQYNLHVGTAGPKDQTPETWKLMRQLRSHMPPRYGICSSVMKTLY